MLNTQQAGALCALALQNSFQNLIVRYSRVMYGGGGPVYIASTAVLLSPLPERFDRKGTRAGTVFVDVFAAGREPLGHAGNIGMVYAIGPEGSQAESAQDFVGGCEATGEAMLRALSQHNSAGGAARLDVVRVCVI